MSPPGMPPPPAGAAAFSGLSATTASVVRNSAAMDAAFCSADRVTFAGSTMPRLEHVDVLAGFGVEPVSDRQIRDLLGDDAALVAGVDRDLLQRRGERDLDDVGTGRLVIGQV